ncbi:AAA family ATPase [Streptomyces zhihengii]
MRDPDGHGRFPAGAIDFGDGLRGIDVLAVDEAPMVDEPRRRPALAEAARLFRTQVVAIGGPLQLQAVSTGGWFAESTAWSPPSQTAASSTRRCTLPTPTRQGRSSPAGRLPTALPLGFTPAPNLHPDQVPRLVQARVGLGPPGGAQRVGRAASTALSSGSGTGSEVVTAWPRWVMR